LPAAGGVRKTLEPSAFFTGVFLNANQASPTELLFPHLVNGGGYTTQFILFSGAAKQSSSGDLRLLKQDGSPFDLTVK